MTSNQLKSAQGEEAYNRALLRLFHDLSVFEKRAGKHTLGRPAAETLIILADCDIQTVGQISDALAYSPSKTTRCVSRLLTFNLAEEIPNPQDLRTCRVSITRKGRNVAFELSRILGREATASLVRQSSAMRRAADAQMSPVVPRPTEAQQRLILILSTSNGPKSIGELAQEAHLTQPNTSMSIERLRELGIVNTSIEQDKRMRLARLSADGERIACAMLHMLEMEWPKP